MNEKIQILWDDGERILCRGQCPAPAGQDVLFVRLVAEQPAPASLDRLTHELELKEELDPSWAVRPLGITCTTSRVVLALEDPGGEPLARLLGTPLEIGHFFELATGIAGALNKLHQRGIVHKDLKPAHIFVHCADGQARLTGFGLASRLPRERQSPAPLETIAGTLAYMAPEQTGRMNRSVDLRSDLYSLGVTFYQMVTGVLPFVANAPLEWVHCHIARTPLPPHERVDSVPTVISRIIMKLLAKTAEERYQTAFGVEHDLRRCLADWQRHRRIDDFGLDEHSALRQLVIPERLYGRERAVDTLFATFARLLENGAPQLVLVSGYSGIGKTSAVNELHKVLVPPRGLFASGKFDQYKRDIPYSTLIQAFQGLARMLLGMVDTELERWRAALLQALAPNAALVSELIPELKLIIGEASPVPKLEPQQAKQRFLQVFQRFIGVFAQADHPLVLFLDDLQWVDPATLDLLTELLGNPDVRYLMVIGAFRDNEVDKAHPLTKKLKAISNAGTKIVEILLTPLTLDDVAQLIADALHCARESIEPLARLVRGKTDGNPFFVIQFLQALAEGDLLTFDHEARRWNWDSKRILAKGYTDNIVDLLASKLTRIPPATRHALQQLACLGHVADNGTLSALLGVSENEVHAMLWEPVRNELVVRVEGAYAFVHDRVHEAAYSLIPETSRADAHLRTGRLLIAQTPADKREKAIFEIVGQLNRGAVLITARDERDQLADLNLLAGQRAKTSTAYSAALTYFSTGASLLGDDRWQRRHEAAFTLELNLAECELLTGQLLTAEARLAALARHATTDPERAQVACCQLDIYVILRQTDTAIAVGLAFLRQVGIEWSPHPDEMTVRHEYERIGSLLGDRTIEELIDLPPMRDVVALATIEALTALVPPAIDTDANLACLALCKAINLSLEHGNADASCVAYARFPRFATLLFGDYEAGFQFGRLACKLVEERGLERYRTRTYLCYCLYVARWVEPVQGCVDQLRRVFDTANQTGDLTYAVFAYAHLVQTLLLTGTPLLDVQREAETCLAHARKAQFGITVDFVEEKLALIRTLRGLAPELGDTDGAQFSPQRGEHLPARSSVTNSRWYWLRELQERYLAGDYKAAMEAASNAQGLLWTTYIYNEATEYYLYAALALAAQCDFIPPGERTQELDTLTARHDQLRIWSTLCPENFAGHTALVGAEIARLEGRVVDAEMLYEQADNSAKKSGFAHVEALANERASRFYAARGLDTIGRMYLRNARYAYLRWGANGKVRQLEEQYTYLRSWEAEPRPMNTMAAPIGHLELATVIKVLQAASGESQLEKLVELIMRTAIEQAGAQRGLLVLSDGDKPLVAAEVTTAGDVVHVQLPGVPVNAVLLPELIVNQVLRTREDIFLDDAITDPSTAADPYVRLHHARSILCLPLMNGAKLMGALYLENNLAARVFSPARLAVLKLVASQAAISLEHARSEARYREVQTELAHANRVATMGQLAASIAHEINQPIATTVIDAQAALRWLNRKTPNIDEVSQALNRIVSGADRAGNVLGRIRQLVRKAPRRTEPLDINEAIRGIETLVQGEARKSVTQLEIQLTEGLPLIDGDRVELQQVVLNLIINAMEAMGSLDGPRDVHVSTGEAAGGCVIVTVRDTGPGFGPNGAEHAFDAFYTTKPTGLGMGLSICRSIIDAHGGRLWASEGSPRGAVIQFSIPQSSAV